MAHFQSSAGFGSRSFSKTLDEYLASTLAKLNAWRRDTAQRRAMAELSDDTLRDVGHAPDIAPKPVIEVEAGLMSKLMSMR
ncbi:DUF1127 domain-containing protein [Ensifer sp. LC163]|uniref:DUF1127 domain-containing protein n=1 Tax=Ensifer sp. LC163 TaxID=1120652 RepID=UPI000813CFC9|nr:DUF1127 domain-containing protein [Ensifer sp. LC163]OCP15096.1 hypothetical protein BC360_17450 [Ensifer sp. LC163]